MAILNNGRISKTELAENSELYDLVKYLDRQAMQQQGYKIEATKKKAALKQQNQNIDNIYNYDNNPNNTSNGNQGSDLEQHPELPYMGGKAIDQPIIPENAAEAVPDAFLSQEQKIRRDEKNKKQQEKQRKDLANRLNNKFKISGPAPKQQPKYAPENRPRNAPPKLRPAGS